MMEGSPVYNLMVFAFKSVHIADRYWNSGGTGGKQESEADMCERMDAIFDSVAPGGVQYFPPQKKTFKLSEMRILMEGRGDGGVVNVSAEGRRHCRVRGQLEL